MQVLAAAVSLGDIVVGKHAGRSATADPNGIAGADLTGCGAQDAAVGAQDWAKIQAQKAKPLRWHAVHNGQDVFL